MIIIRYLVRETLKSQIAILFILLLIFFSQKLVRILGAAVDGEIPAIKAHKESAPATEQAAAAVVLQSFKESLP